LDLLSAARGLHSSQSFDLLGVCLNAPLGDHASQQLPFPDAEDTLLWIKLEAIPPHIIESFDQVRNVIFFSFAHNDDVINISRGVAPSWLPRISFIMRLKVDPALRRPFGILTKQKMPKGVVNPVLASSSLHIHTWWYPEKQSRRLSISHPAA
jgi:hypothetical protein